MKNQRLHSDFNCALAWAIFTLGATHLALVLGGPITLLIVLFCCASLFAFFLVKVQAPEKRTPNGIVKPYLLSTGILLVCNLFYYYLVFLETNVSFAVFFIVSTLLFIIPLLITVPFLHKSAHVSQ